MEPVGFQASIKTSGKYCAIKVNSTNQKVLILGGGIAGITAALALGRLNIPVVLIEKSEALGGMVRNFCCKATDACQQCGACLLNDSLTALAQDPTVEIHLQTELTAHKNGSQRISLYL